MESGGGDSGSSHSCSALPCLVNLALEIISMHQIVGCYDAFISFSFFILTADFSHCLLSLYCNFFVLSSFDSFDV